MTRYDKGRKAQTRLDILDAASQALRENGIDAVRVADVMADAGLTHGGFYAHFGSKDQLVREACEHALRRSARKNSRKEGSVPGTDELAAFIRAYLSRSHRDNPSHGCVVPALAGELARRSPETREAFTAAAREYVGRIVSLSGGELNEDQGWVLLAGMAGTIMLARAVDDPALSDRILASAREAYCAPIPSVSGEAENVR